MKHQLKLELERPVEKALILYHLSSITPNKKKCQLQDELIQLQTSIITDTTCTPKQRLTTLAGGKIFFQLSNKPSQCKHHSSTNEKPLLPKLLLSSNELSLFFLLISLLACPPSFKSLPSGITSQNISLLARWDAAIHKSFNKVS